MTDPLSATAGVIGITAAALHSARKLHAFIEAIREAPKAIANIKEDLAAVDAVLGSLGKALQDQNLPDELKPLRQDVKVELAVQICEKACVEFKETLANWMRHSTEEKIFWWDRVKAGYLGEAKVRAFTAQVGTCKATISVALNTATFLNSCRQIQTTEEIRAMMLASKENEIKQQAQDADRQIAMVETQLQQLSFANAGQGQKLEQSRLRLIDDVKQQRSLLDAYREVCEDAQEKIHYKLSGQKIKKVRATGTSYMLVGIINAEGEESKIKQDIEDISAETASTVVVGVARNIDIPQLISRSKSHKPTW